MTNQKMFLNKYLEYSPSTGKLIWVKQNSYSKKDGTEAGTIRLLKSTRKRYIALNYTVYDSLFCAWSLYHGKFPAGKIVPKNGDWLDARIENLEEING